MEIEDHIRKIRYERLNTEFASWAIKGAILVIMSDEGAVEGGPSMSEEEIEEKVCTMTRTQKVQALKIAANLLKDYGDEG